MKKALLNKIFSFGMGVVIAVTPFSLFGSALSISQTRSDVFLECVELSDDRFDLSFIHSVSLTPVVDKYSVVTRGNELSILQTAEHFIAHGQGLPSLLNEPDAYDFESKNGEFILKMHREIPNLIVRTDSRFQNRLHTSDITVNLNQWSDIGLHIVPIQACEPDVTTVIKNE
ncbi:DUF1850 domain-containing protein [Marinomonas sp. 15G1-11]|uniref:DUF1850 domain-containing protein n=1 Tax=Marinomonas phaeophyticola TaxID=3004091 RepID=A0ABT4JPP3_9GAMM|nr:DUF1850 domain-containing protein [Marinomonas sp. 15G1-11]MCZ2720116.1 DUF1850 domain-containing protein [Marinomonas sp. 15G1-11]